MASKKWLLALSVGVMIPFTVLAQEDAGRLEKRFEKPLEPKSVSQPLMFPIQEQLPPEQAGQIRFTLKQLAFTGNTAFSADQLGVLATSILDKDVSLLDIYHLRDAITKKYGEAGYGLSKAIIPEQRIQTEGIVQVQIIEGFVDEVIIEGASTAQRDYLAHAAEKIKAERPLNVKTLERYLLLANDRFAIKVTSTLKPSKKKTAASTLILKVETAPKLDGGLTIDNRGTDSVGKGQLYGNVSVNGLRGRASKTTLGYATVERPSELQYWSVSHAEILSQEGTSLTLGYTNTYSEPGKVTLRTLDQKSYSNGWSAKIAHPFLRTRQANLSAHVKYDQKDTEGAALSTTTSLDRIRSLRFGVSYDNADTFGGVNQALVEYSKGIAGLGATEDDSMLKSRAEGHADYQKITVNLSRKQELGTFIPMLNQFSLYAAVMGQYSDRSLLSPEEFGIGGQEFGRAYDSSEILGDSGMAGSVELRYALNIQESSFISHVQFYTFYDAGTIRNHNAVQTDGDLTESLSSAGVGVRYGLWKNVTGGIEYAKPLSRDVANEGNKDGRIFASISTRF